VGELTAVEIRDLRRQADGTGLLHLSALENRSGRPGRVGVAVRRHDAPLSGSGGLRLGDGFLLADAPELLTSAAIQEYVRAARVDTTRKPISGC
jgi:hypothetical protein